MHFSGIRSRSRLAGWLLALAGYLVAAPQARPQDTAVQTILHSFGGTGDGRQPRTGPVRDANGDFYGTTYYGGRSDCGTIYRVAADGTYTLLHSFGSTDAYPDTALVAGSDGNLYGTTTYGGTASGSLPGTIYRITPTGEFTTLRTFNSAEFGGPSTGLVLGRDGNFYASAQEGGYNSTVTVIYRVTPQGEYSIFHLFTAAEGGHPDAPLVLGRDGNFYGTTTNGGAYGYGTVFSLGPSGALKVIHDFDSFTSPPAALTEGADGVFYGTTSYGRGGFILRVTSAGDYAVLHRFGDLDGDHLYSALTPAGDGTLYGVTANTIYRLAPDGTYTVLIMLGSTQGSLVSALLPGRNGGLYAISDNFYTADGAFFMLTLAPVPSSFFAAEVPIGNGFYSLNYDRTNTIGYDFGYYHYFEDRHYIYHLQFGYEYVIDAADGVSGVYLYDFKSQGFFYTSPTFPFPYLYDFNLESVVFHFGGIEFAGPPGTDPIERRYFYVFRTGQFIMK